MSVCVHLSSSKNSSFGKGILYSIYYSSIYIGDAKKMCTQHELSCLHSVVIIKCECSDNVCVLNNAYPSNRPIHFS